MAYIDQRAILSLHANILDFRQSSLSFIIGSDIDRLAFKAQSSEPCKAISVYAHHDDLWSFAQLTISIPDRRKGLISDRTHGQWTTVYKSARGSWLAVPYSAKTYTFYMRSTAYKKQEAPDRRSLTQQKLSLFTYVAPHTKSKELSIGGPLLSKNLVFLYA
jgi:hypothetical protein